MNADAVVYSETTLDSSDPALFAQRPWLSTEQCQGLVDEVMRLRPHWTQRSPVAPFYTLGAPSYLDGKVGDDSAYRARVAETNPLLRAHFGEFIDAFIAALGGWLQQPVRLDPAIACPGFHIFLAAPAFLKSHASVHVDRQYHQIQWPDGQMPDDGPQLSFTLPLKLPRGGAGLRVWDISSLSFNQLAADERAAVVRAKREPIVHQYAVGEVQIHSGHLIHQIAPWTEIVDGDARITLQSHAIWRGDHWLVYW